MDTEIYNKAKKIDKEISELQDCKLLLMKGCIIELRKDGKKYKLFISIIPEIIDLVYWSPNVEDKISIDNKETDLSISQRLEDVVDRALTIIDNKEWENV